MDVEQEFAELAKGESKIAHWIRYLIDEDKKIQADIRALKEKIAKMQEQLDLVGSTTLDLIQKDDPSKKTGQKS